MTHYEINVAKQNEQGWYVHLFATAPRSGMDAFSARRVWRELRAKFPLPIYEVSLTLHEENNRMIDTDSEEFEW